MFGKVTKTHEHAGEFGGLPNQAMTPTSRAHLSCEPPIPVMEKSQQSSGRAKIIHHYFTNAFTDCSALLAAQTCRQPLPRRNNPRFSFSTFGHVIA
jgi:hypothetical protein